MRNFIDISNEFTHQQSVLSMMMKFVDFVVQELELPDAPNIELLYGGDMGTTFGCYHLQTNDIKVQIKNRHPLDVMRTLAHEIYHYKQNLNGELNVEDGRTGSDIENEANMMAGILLRNFAKLNPEYFLLPAIT